MIIGVDIDNVIADTEKELRRVLAADFGIRLEREEITDYALREIPQIDELTHKELMAMFKVGEIFLNLDAMDGARETLASLVTRHEVHLVTSRPPHVREQTESWLTSHKIPYERLIFAETSKLNGVPYELFIEDQENFAVELAESGAFVLLFDAPWNRHVEHVNIDRVFGWDDVRRFCFPPCAIGH